MTALATAAHLTSKDKSITRTLMRITIDDKAYDIFTAQIDLDKNVSKPLD